MASWWLSVTPESSTKWSSSTATRSRSLATTSSAQLRSRSPTSVQSILIDGILVALGDAREQHEVVLLDRDPQQELGHHLVRAAQVEEPDLGEVELGGAVARARDGLLDPVAARGAGRAGDHVGIRGGDCLAEQRGQIDALHHRGSASWAGMVI